MNFRYARFYHILRSTQGRQVRDVGPAEVGSLLGHRATLRAVGLGRGGLAESAFSPLPT